MPVVEQWASEPQADGTRSLFVLGASDYEVTVHTIGIVAMSAAYLAGCVADSLDRTPAVIAATLSDPQSLAAAEASCLGADPEHPDSVTVIELSDGYSGFYMADSHPGRRDSAAHHTRYGNRTDKPLPQRRL